MTGRSPADVSWVGMPEETHQSFVIRIFGVIVASRHCGARKLMEFFSNGFNMYTDLLSAGVEPADLI